MARAKKDGTHWNTYVSTDLFDTVSRYSNKTGLPKTVILEQSLREYFESRQEPITKNEEQE